MFEYFTVMPCFKLNFKCRMHQNIKNIFKKRITLVYTASESVTLTAIIWNSINLTVNEYITVGQWFHRSRMTTGHNAVGVWCCRKPEVARWGLSYSKDKEMVMHSKIQKFSQISESFQVIPTWNLFWLLDHFKTDFFRPEPPSCECTAEN